MKEYYKQCYNDSEIITMCYRKRKADVIMWNRADVKQQGKAAFKSNYWRSVLCAFILSILTGLTASNSVTTMQDDQQSNEEVVQSFNDVSGGDQTLATAFIVGFIAASLILFVVVLVLKIFIFNPLQVGCYGFFKENILGQGVDLGVVKSGFVSYGHTFATLLLRDIFTLLWTCLFIVPGIVKMYSYRMVPFILRDDPQLTATEAITSSRRMMNGHKWNTFVLDLSFIGWYILGGLTFGIVNLLWTEPYRQSSNAALYLKLSGQE